MEGIQACSISTLEGRMLVSASAQTTLPMEFPLARLVAGLSPWLGDGDASDVAVFGLRDHEVVIARGSRDTAVAVVTDGRDCAETRQAAALHARQLADCAAQAAVALHHALRAGPDD
ncbi:hypothetical protein JL720_5581 [Aureococcus anophagefferens]|nr:hypothetical protein JL720_5581 [Aureococcus anophagefferens]